MKHSIKIRLSDSYFLGLLLVGIVFSNGGCGLGDDDFSDIKVIEQIIKEDKEQIFGAAIADDGEIAPEDTSISKTFLSKALALTFGRIIRDVTVTPVVTLISDTLAFAATRYSLEGDFKVVLLNGDGFSKPFAHTINRYATFVKRKDLVTGAQWSRVSTSAAFGYADNSKLSLDTVYIATPNDTIVATDAAEIVSLEKKHIILHRGDPISIVVSAQNAFASADTLFGNIVMGMNRNVEGRARLRLPPTGNRRYMRTVFVGPSQPSGFNQLMIDFITRGTLLNRAAPYDSFILLIPYRVID